MRWRDMVLWKQSEVLLVRPWANLGRYAVRIGSLVGSTWVRSPEWSTDVMPALRRKA